MLFGLRQGGGVRGFCYSCNQAISPHTRHVLWECLALLLCLLLPLLRGLAGAGRLKGQGLV